MKLDDVQAIDIKIISLSPEIEELKGLLEFQKKNVALIENEIISLNDLKKNSEILSHQLLSKVNERNKISAEVENPNNHNISVTAYISLDDTTVVDSISLSEVGAAGTGIWGTLWSTAAEDFYKVSVKTTYHDVLDSRIIPNVARFSSTGPIVV